MSKVRTCLYPVAGLGTRFLPVTKVVPKELLPIGSKPLVHFAVDEAINSEIFNHVFVINIQKESIKEYFSENKSLNTHLFNSSKTDYLKDINQIISENNFSFVYQSKMQGLGNAIYTAKDVIGNESFAVLLPDDLCLAEKDPVLSQLKEIHKLYPGCSLIAIEEVEENLIDKYGIVSGSYLDDSKRVLQVNDMIEKPSIGFAPSNLAIIGRYILTSDIFHALEETSPDQNGEIQITDALKILAKENKVLAYKYSGKRFDCGTPKGMLLAQNKIRNP